MPEAPKPRDESVPRPTATGEVEVDRTSSARQEETSPVLWDPETVVDAENILQEQYEAGQAAIRAERGNPYGRTPEDRKRATEAAGRIRYGYTDEDGVEHPPALRPTQAQRTVAEARARVEAASRSKVEDINIQTTGQHRAEEDLRADHPQS